MTTWTDHHEKILDDGYKARKSARQIAEELTAAGYPSTRNTVLGRIHRKGWSKPRPELRKPKALYIAEPSHSLACRWPIGDPGTPDFRFCEAATVVPGKPYCPDHCRIAYRDKDEVQEKVHEPKPQRPGTIALAPTVAPMRGAA